jgi:Asp-tRNA(Asn)/Glu-tRNA(Gln) amidotransferase A subunit family amidase
VLALPTLLVDPPTLGADASLLVATTVAVNLAGNPALAMPIPRPGRPAASLQLVGRPHGEELLLAAGAQLEAVISGR